MSTLHLDSLEIKNFRCFEHLVIEKLGRVNLIVGKNSVGKTCLLEALRLYAHNGSPLVIRDILALREETNYVNLIMDDGHSEASISFESLKYLFYSRHLDIGGTKIIIGPNPSSDSSLEISVDMFTQERDSEKGQLVLVGPISPDDYHRYLDIFPRITLHHSSLYWQYPLEFNQHANFLQKDTFSWFIPTHGLNPDEISNLWARTALTAGQDVVLSALKKVVGEIEGISLVGIGSRRSQNPVAIGKMRDQDPTPLRTLGDGLTRAFGVGLAMVDSNKFLLIDEFETGLHHSVQTELWRLIFSTAKILNVQVFATTHSWDCVEAFQEAAAEDQNEEAMLIRLQKKKNSEEIEAELYDEHLLGMATRQQVEVR